MSLRWAFISLLFLLIRSSITAQGLQYYTGTINGKYTLYARLEPDSRRNEIYGYYFYSIQKEEIALYGETKGDSVFIAENDGLYATGWFSGKRWTGDSITGRWTDGGRKNFPFVWRKITQKEYEKQLPDKESLDRIQYHQLHELALRFWHITGDTGRIKNFYEGLYIPEKHIRAYLFPENYENETEEENDESNKYYIHYYGYIFFRENYLGLFINRYFSPGAGGVNDHTIFLLTFDYFGNPVDKEEIGCNCMDTNMGSNDYYETALQLHLLPDRLVAGITDTHATLDVTELKEGEKETEEIKSRRKIFLLDKEGHITER